MKHEDDSFYAKLFNIDSYDGGLDDNAEEMTPEDVKHEDFEHGTPREKSDAGGGADHHRHGDQAEHCFYSKAKYTYLDCQKHLADLRFTKAYI
jgi:hypothetical protein